MSKSSSKGWRNVRAVTATLALALLPGVGRLSAAPISQERAVQAANAWLSLSPETMHERHGNLAGTVTPVRDALGNAEFYAIDLAPRGYVIVAADDGVEPIVAFSNSDNFHAAPGHPLYDMLMGDVPSRISHARASHAAPAARWRMLQTIAAAPKGLANDAVVLTAGGKSSVSDVRVSPLVHTRWNQQTVDGMPVFNYYTPPYGAGNPSNYPTGCVATMLGQLMRFYQWPQTGVGTNNYQITVNNAGKQRALRGGDGQGGPYDWADMTLNPYPGMPASQQQAIGALLADAGVASNMAYAADASGADIKASVLTNIFHYASADSSQSDLASLEIAIKANLDAGSPVGLGVTGGGYGHAIVADGYGYNGATLYTHLNLGWSGDDDAWYNLPTVVAGGYDFTTVNSALFNIDPTVKGEIVSGRITDGSGNPVAGAVVTFASGSTVVTATSNAEGIYAAKGLASNSTWTITPAAESLAFAPPKITVTTGHSSSNGGVGDKTGEDFSSQLVTGALTVEINSGAAAAGAQWRVGSGPWEVAGATVTGIPTGTRTVTFRATRDWTPPPARQVTVVANQVCSISVSYAPQYSLTAVPDDAAHGQVAANPEPGDLGSYAPGASVTLTATPGPGYYFGGWVESGTLVSTDATYTSKVEGARQLVANFPPNSLTGRNTQAYVTSNQAVDTIDVLADLSDGGGTPVILSVTQPSNGTVTINPDGTLAFTPGKSFRGSAQFSYTAGNGNGGTITRQVTITNWYAASAGTYTGLSVAADVTNETSGYLRVTVSASGAFSGKLTVAGVSYTLSGAFDDNANYQTVVTRKDAPDLTVALHLVPASEITGAVDDGTTTSEVTADRTTYSASNKTALAGKYTALLSGNAAAPGNGMMLVTISPTGGVAATGRLADGQVVSMGASLNADGAVPYYAGVYKSATGAGSLLGTMLFDSGTNPECSGTYAWFRPSSAGTDYPDGFAESGGVTGAPVPGATGGVGLRGAAATAITAQLSGGGLTADITESGQVTTDGKIVWTTPNPRDLTLSIGATGQVTGSFIDPATGKKRAVLGAWLADQQFGGGFFLGDGSAGALTLSGPPGG